MFGALYWVTPERTDRFGGLPYPILFTMQRALTSFFPNGKRGLDFMKQTAIMLGKQASKQASKLNYALSLVFWQPLLSRDAV
jgi:hypothetical protein